MTSEEIIKLVDALASKPVQSFAITGDGGVAVHFMPHPTVVTSASGAPSVSVDASKAGSVSLDGMPLDELLG